MRLERFGRTSMNLPKSELELLSELHNSCLTLVSHDAGGANVLEAFLRANNLVPKRTEISGPAGKILGLAEGFVLGNTEEGMPEIVLASTGWQSEFEKEHIKVALDSGVRVVVFLDHWTNYVERISDARGMLEISEFVTFDSVAKKMAMAAFPQAKIYQFPNCYLSEQSNKIRALRKGSEDFDVDYLYIGEPIRNRKYSESDAFENFLEKVHFINPGRLKIAVRPHPSETRDTYSSIVQSHFNFLFFVTKDTSLVEDLSRTKFVVGCNSMALELAHLSNIPVYCAIPEPFESELPINIFKDWN